MNCVAIESVHVLQCIVYKTHTFDPVSGLKVENLYKMAIGIAPNDQVIMEV